MPIFFFSQLMGLAMDIDQRELGFEKLVVSPFELLAETVYAPEGAGEAKPKRTRAAKPKKWGEA